MTIVRFAVAALAAALALSVQAQTLPMRAGESRPAANAAAKSSEAARTARMRVDGAPARRVELAKPAASELRRLVELNGGDSAIASPGRPQFIGFGRDVPAGARVVALDAAAWTSAAEGMRTLRVEVASPGAAALRVAIRLPAMPPGATVRFAAAGDTATRYAVPASEVAGATLQFGEYWSPVIDSERVAIEIDMPADARVAGATLEIARLSHLVVGATASRAEELKLLQDVGGSGPCNLDYQCAAPQDQATWNAADATGKLVFTTEYGSTARCTGTLLNDTTSSGTPYLFSASHCFENAYRAANLQVWWFFDSASCGSLQPGAYTVQTGGAALLGRSRDWDWALLRLNGAPPEAVWFSGWNAETLPASSPVEIFHHPRGDLKKWSQGVSFTQVPVFIEPVTGGDGTFTRVMWTRGTTEGGSSGGALRWWNGEYLEVRGGLLGGDAYCENPAGSDYFSQFGAMLPLVRPYLTPNAVPADLFTVVEFYHPQLNHYFVTANPIEIGILDSGTLGWQRTGFTFLAYTGPGAGRSPVCRFYQRDNDSHFYSASPTECAQVQAGFPDWVLESPNVFYIGLPDPVSGACAAGTKPVYRFYHRPVVNHRFTTERTVANELNAAWDWTSEGYGPVSPYKAMCSPIGI